MKTNKRLEILIPCCTFAILAGSTEKGARSFFVLLTMVFLAWYLTSFLMDDDKDGK